MIATTLLSHSDGTTGSHMDGGSVWMFVSMVAFSLFLLLFAWSLLRPSKPPSTAPADAAAKLYAQGKISAEEFERIVCNVESRSPRHRT